MKIVREASGNEEKIILSHREYRDLLEQACNWRDAYLDEKSERQRVDGLLSAVCDQNLMVRKAVMLLLENPNLAEDIIEAEEN